MENNFSIKDKQKYLLDEISKIKNQWNDLNLGCDELFGTYYYGLKKNIAINNEIRNLFDFNKITEVITNRENYFFKVAHSTHNLEIEMKFWPNAKIIYFHNYTNFIKTYRLDLTSKYQQVRGSDWPECYPDIDIYLSLPSNIKEDICYYFEEFLTINLMSDISDQILYRWSVDDYLSFDQTYSGLLEIYKILGISDVDKQTVKSYYDSWIDKLTELKNNNKELE